MKSVAFLIMSMFISISSFAEQLELPLEPQQCISVSQAKTVLNKYLSPLVGQVLVDDFSWLSEDDAVLTQRDVTHALASLTWDAKSFAYETSAIVDGYCAAGASCWGWYAVDCNGNIEARMDGEE
ncbi:hypothetical protein [Bdellovibrio bacteriovorus]|uniref:hypothetical protein n=1 Tax=Bdellovibrio TaxID=958 RepID=UPI0035A8B5DE